MTVYVDDARIPAQVGSIYGRWSHLLADSRAELDQFAARLRLRQSYIQKPGTPREHYDLIDAKREQAIRLGAIPISFAEAGHLVAAKRDGRRLDLAEARRQRQTAQRPFLVGGQPGSGKAYAGRALAALAVVGSDPGEAPGGDAS